MGREGRWKRLLNVLEGRRKKPKGKGVWRTKGEGGEGLGCKLIGGQDGKEKIGLGEERASRSTVLEG